MVGAFFFAGNYAILSDSEKKSGRNGGSCLPALSDWIKERNKKMHVRTLEPKEAYRSGLGFAVAFEAPFDLAQEKAKAEAMTMEEIEDAKKIPKRTWGAFSEDEKVLYGSIDVSSYPVRFDGSQTRMGGIGGVETLPPYRRKGAIRACMQAAFESMYEEGYGFSFLYPFSHAYYRKFGYESAAREETWTIQLSALRAADVGGSVDILLPGDDFLELTDIYNQFYATYNLSVIRQEFQRDLAQKNILEQKQYCYVWRDETGRARGFLLFKNREKVLDCTCSFASGQNAFLFLDARALEGLLYFVKTAFAADYQAIRFSLPERFPIDMIIGEGNGAQMSSCYHGMARVIHAGKVLEMCRCKGSGSLRIGLKDEQLPQNTGVWELVYEPGRPNQVQKLQVTGEEADVQLTIQDFTTLICGIHSWEDIPYMPQVKALKEADFEAVFYRKKSHVLNLF